MIKPFSSAGNSAKKIVKMGKNQYLCCLVRKARLIFVVSVKNRSLAKPGSTLICGS